MRRSTFLACCQLLALVLLCSLPRLAHAAVKAIVVVSTSGSRAWPAAERRLVAELQAMGLRVLLLAPRPKVEPRLAGYARSYEAVAAVQVVRRGDNGVVRLWLGQPWHISVNLRNPEVVSLAVLPAVEFIFQRSFDLSLLSHAAGSQSPGSAASSVSPTDSAPAASAPAANAPLHQAPSKPATGEKRWGAPVYGPPVRYHVRSEMTYAARLGVGPWFSGAETTPAVNVVLGMRAHWFKWMSFEAEGFVHAIPHLVESSVGSGRLQFSGARVYALWEPWPHSNVSLGVGPGVGVLRVDPLFTRLQLGSRASPLLSLRAELAAPLAPMVDVLFVVTSTRATRRFAGFSRVAPTEPLLSAGLDAMLAVDWHWQ